MGLIGGQLTYRLLRSLYPGGANVPMAQGNPYNARGVVKLVELFGPNIFAELGGKTVLDFGCGDGENAIELAEHGARRVIGLGLLEWKQRQRTGQRRCGDGRDKSCGRQCGADSGEEHDDRLVLSVGRG